MMANTNSSSQNEQNQKYLIFPNSSKKSYKKAFILSPKSGSKPESLGYLIRLDNDLSSSNSKPEVLEQSETTFGFWLE